MLAAIDQNRRPRHCRCGGDEAHCGRDVVRRAAFTQRRDAVRFLELSGRLIARRQCNARCHADHAYPRCQCLRQHGNGSVQCCLGQGIGEEIGIGIVQLLIKQIDDHCLSACRCCLKQGLCQYDRRPDVGVHVRIQRGHGEAVGLILLKQGGIVDHTGDRPELSGLTHQFAHGGFVSQVALQRDGTASQRGNFSNDFPCLVFRTTVMDGDIPAVTCQRDRNGATDAPGGAGDECNLLSGWVHGIHFIRQVWAQLWRYGWHWRRNRGIRRRKCSFKYNTPIMPLQLPEPSADALAASRSLQLLIADDIRRHGGWISFARYMELVLYAPELGYYSGGSAKLGKDGDFTTAPEISPLFGATLAQLATELFAQTDAAIMEFGAGTGRLAFDILSELQAAGTLPDRYYIVEISAQLRARQQDTLRAFPQVVWLDQLPPAFSGVVIGNEVLDAMPVQLVVRGEQGWLERGVALDASGRFLYEDHPCDAMLVAQIPEAGALPPGYLTEVHPVAAGFMRSLAAMLSAGQGAALLIDYGFPAAEYYFPERNQGTLMCHYRHHAHADPFYLPGLQDVTAHVDFTAMAHAAMEGGLEVLGYASQAAFLLGAGIGELLLRTPPEHSERYLPQANAVQKLISPAEMGELFKILAVGRQIDWPQRLLMHDRTHRL